MKKYGCLVAIVLVVGLTALACYGFVHFQRKFLLGMSSPYLFVSADAMQECQAHFLTEGFQDRGISLYVSPASESQEDPKWVADLSWWANYFHSAVWSHDGSVIACRADVTTKEDAAESAQKKLDKDAPYKPKPQYTPYACAYDFQEGKTFILKTACYGPRSDWEAHSKAIEELLSSRGGLGKEVTKREIDQESRKLDGTQWQTYRSAGRRAAL